MKCALVSLILIAALLAGIAPAGTAAAVGSTSQPRSQSWAYSGGDHLGVQDFLDAQPGVLKGYADGAESAATIIESNSLYYGLSPRLHLALLETVSQLLSAPAPPDAALRQPFGSAGPTGFAAQVEWASRELRAGLGPYDRPPTLRFSDGLTITLTLNQAPEGVAVQRFLAQGRSSAEWRALVERFQKVFQDYFNNELPAIGDWRLDLGPNPPSGANLGAPIALLAPWPAGVRMVHLAYFDHVYPTVDSGDDGNSFVVNFLGRGNVQYNGHDGHDYYFPDRPVGTPILAAAAGVAYARTHRGNGVVILHPGGYETVYWHLDEFAPIFEGRVDRDGGVRVDAGAFIGTSGRSGFVRGNPHLHFEVRRFGQQVDPYGWQGAGPDPCPAYYGCGPSTWLWHPGLAGTYDFSPGTQRAAPGDASRERASVGQLPAASLQAHDRNPPVGTLALNPPDGLRLLAHFDGHAVQEVGAGFAVAEGQPAFEEGRYGQALRLPAEGGLTYPISENLRLEAGSIGLWAKLPERYPPTSTGRHYLFAASASAADEARIYTGTLALRREAGGAGEPARWNFWTVPQSGAQGRSDLSAPDTLAPGWHHFAVTWDAAAGTKALYLDGSQVAATQGVTLPVEVGSVLQLGRFTYGGRLMGAALDELALYGGVLRPVAVAALAAAVEPPDGSAPLIRRPRLLLDTNAADDEGGIVAVQLGRDGSFGDPQPYYDAFRWTLPPVEGSYALAVRYFDRAGNSTTVTRTVMLDLPPQPRAALIAANDLQATLVIAATDAQPPLEMQLSERADFAGAAWQPLRARVEWPWRVGARAVYVRLRDASGETSAPVHLAGDALVYLPVVRK